MELAIGLLMIAIKGYEMELKDSIKLSKTCDETVRQIFEDGAKQNRSYIKDIKKAIKVLTN